MRPRARIGNLILRERVLAKIFFAGVNVDWPPRRLFISERDAVFRPSVRSFARSLVYSSVRSFVRSSARSRLFIKSSNLPLTMLVNIHPAR